MKEFIDFSKVVFLNLLEVKNLQICSLTNQTEIFADGYLDEISTTQKNMSEL